MAEGEGAEESVLDGVARFMADAKAEEEAAKNRMEPLPAASHIPQEDLETAIRVSL
jgi:hypothetical protein